MGDEAGGRDGPLSCCGSPLGCVSSLAVGPHCLLLGVHLAACHLLAAVGPPWLLWVLTGCRSSLPSVGSSWLLWLLLAAFGPHWLWVLLAVVGTQASLRTQAS